MDLEPIYKIFPTQSDGLTYLEKVRWNNEPVCPKCRSSKFSPVTGKQAYHCNFCNRTFTVTTNSIFHKSKIDIQKWFYAIIVMLQPSENITARDLAQKINTTKDTAWAIQKKIKNALITSPELISAIDRTLNQIIYGNK